MSRKNSLKPLRQRRTRTRHMGRLIYQSRRSHRGDDIFAPVNTQEKDRWPANCRITVADLDSAVRESYFPNRHRP